MALTRSHRWKVEEEEEGHSVECLESLKISLCDFELVTSHLWDLVA